jgi:hypothetical protein
MTLGITGHQDLQSFNVNWILQELNNFISKNNIHKGISSLAIGADQLFASELKRKKIHYDVIIPCASYASTFKTKKDLELFLSLLNSAENSTILNFQEPSEIAFYTAGTEIIKQSSTIMAIWDGKKAKGLGGTGDIVKEALENNIPVYHINPKTLKCKYLGND